MRRYFEYLDSLGVLEWVDLDLRIVRGLAYYTGIVFELFDAKGELRAVCGGGRYDNLLKALGGVDMPALGFGMGDVVLAELLRDRGLLPSKTPGPEVWIAAEAPSLAGRVRRAATVLRRHGVSVEYALREQALMKQVKAARSAGAEWVLTLREAPDAEGRKHAWSPEPRPEWDELLSSLDI
jgi:histidyl-tRNA synthetase